MRLINTSTLELELFDESAKPLRYAILSHTWTRQEVTFQEYQDHQRKNGLTGMLFKSSIESRSGYRKILNCCRQAKEDGYEWIWIDTCCINKSSSAELSEAINSMFLWYEKSEVCYAYLEDVPADEDYDIPGSSFRESRWFTRGWTLQELIAPSTVVFYSQDWTKIGSKGELENLLAGITGIDNLVLNVGILSSSVSVARRMSWAARRETTRIEDNAYCLLGIFNVNMPLLYGEGQNAFIRLQEEIMKNSDDQSLFTWDYSDDAKVDSSGVLAKSPSAFINSSSIVPFRNWKTSEPYAMTNKGLRLHIPLLRHNLLDTPWRAGEKIIAVFGCRLEAPELDINSTGPIGIEIEPLVDDGDQFVRTRGRPPQPVPMHRLSEMRKETLFIRKDNIKPKAVDMRWKHHFMIRATTVQTYGYSVSAVYPDKFSLKSNLFVRASDLGYAVLSFDGISPPFIIALWNQVPHVGFGAARLIGPNTKDWRYTFVHYSEYYRREKGIQWLQNFEDELDRNLVLAVDVAAEIVFGQDVFAVDINVFDTTTEKGKEIYSKRLKKRKDSPPILSKPKNV